MKLKIGDLVAIRGDKRKKHNGECQYLPQQLILGKYLKHTRHGGIWLGKIEKIQGDMALVGGGWRPLNHYEIIIEGDD